ncbi:gamma carbonic anhydrase family protein [Pacificoceanicola onchidii]|uniref:gamma carbonic anhydrase family protein n=1 Tax=Pacificoceanicola onchidii TaxID=2562685 RepID=UPI0010A47CAC|nr:gamma carbonic anhydrase family protein [Pacificoceanicola onchidii]
MPTYTLDGLSPRLPDTGDYWIAPDANVIGNVALDDGVSIWFGSTVRGDNELICVGAGSNVQENCVLHTDPGFPLRIGVNCTIGHKAILHGCTIGDGALIGMGATILNGAVIGEGALIGAGALIPENKVIPPRALVMGAPGRIVRQLEEAESKGLEASAVHYQQQMRRFRGGLAVV